LISFLARSSFLNRLMSLCLSLAALGMAHGQSRTSVVNYEAFGAKGDGVTDDMPAIRKAHEHANLHGLPVRTKPGATYHVGTKALTAIIATDTDWGTSKFIIDDSKGVEDLNRSIFEVRSLSKPVPLKIDRLKRGQTRLNIRPPTDVLVYVENDKKRLFIRKGGNQNSGTTQKEVFILKKNGDIIGAIDWDYDQITKLTAEPIEPNVLTVKGGYFTSIANQPKPDENSRYWSRNISIKRSKTLIEGVTHRVTEEKDFGHPYRGFLAADKCAYVMYRDCTVDAKKVYSKIGNAGKPVPMGTYGYHASYVVDFRMMNCRMGNDINDRSRWGVVATNFMKNMTVENSALSRVDVHQGVSGEYIIRNSTLGHAGVNAIGRGNLIVENVTFQGGSMINFREDYGSTWDGDVLIRNCTWIVPSGNRPVVFRMSNDGTHDFGYTCSMPRNVKIDGLTIDDSKNRGKIKNLVIFPNATGRSKGKSPFPYRLTEKLEVSGLKLPEGASMKISDSPDIEKAVQVTIKN